MDIGDDEAIYILTKMRKALIDCRDDGIVPREDMNKRIKKVDDLLKIAWSSRSYFPGFVIVSRVLLSMENEPDFPLEAFYDDFKFDAQDADKELLSIFESPQKHKLNKKHADLIHEIKNRLEQYGLTIEHFLKLCMLNLKPFQFSRVISGKLRLSGEWIKQFDDDVKRSHKTLDIINNPYLLFEDYEYWPNSHDDVYGEELDAPIALFKIDIAYFPHTQFQSRIDLQREMSFIDKRRIRALIIRHLKTLEQTGDCFAEADNIQQAMAAYPLYYELDGKYELPEDFFHTISQEYALHFQD